MTAAAQERFAAPLVLVVEDQEPQREAKVKLFEEEGFNVISAVSHRDAAREFRACPLVDLVVTDFNLDRENARDQSGVDLARDVKAAFPELPVVGYSALFDEAEIPKGIRGYFDDIQPKGFESPREMLKKLASWRDWASKYRRLRWQRSQEELDRLRAKYRIDPHDFNLLREFVPNARTAPGDDAPHNVEDVLRQAGYRFRIVEAEDVERDKLVSTQIKYPVFVWVHETSDAVVAEVYRFPDLYASGSSEQEALQMLFSLMRGYYEDLRANSADQLGASLPEMLSHLTRIFG